MTEAVGVDRGVVDFISELYKYIKSTRPDSAELLEQLTTTITTYVDPVNPNSAEEDVGLTLGNPSATLQLLRSGRDLAKTLLGMRLGKTLASDDDGLQRAINQLVEMNDAANFPNANDGLAAVLRGWAAGDVTAGARIGDDKASATDQTIAEDVTAAGARIGDDKAAATDQTIAEDVTAAGARIGDNEAAATTGDDTAADGGARAGRAEAAADTIQVSLDHYL